MQAAFLKESGLPYDVLKEAELRQVLLQLRQTCVHNSAGNGKPVTTIQDLQGLDFYRVPFQQVCPRQDLRTPWVLLEKWSNSLAIC
jgi:hypothetical protein